MSMTQQERQAADARVRAELGVNRKVTGPGAEVMPPRPGSALAVTASTKLPVDDEVYAVQLYGYGEVWGRPGLSLRERSFITLGLLSGTAQSDQLMIHVNNALNLGLTPEEISELLVHVGVYAVVPTWHNGSNITRYVFIERGILSPGAGIRLVPNPPTSQEDRRLNAEKVKTALGCGKIGLWDDAADLAPLGASPRAAGSAAKLAIEDEIAQIQAEYTYGEVWSSPAIDFRTRILVTVAVLQALRLSTQLHAHVNIALNLGVTPEELHEVFLHAGVYSGLAGWQVAVDVARDVFIQRGVLKA